MQNGSPSSNGSLPPPALQSSSPAVAEDSLVPHNVPLKPVRMKRQRAVVESHPECVKCGTVKKRVPGQPSAWAQYLRKFQVENAHLGAMESVIEARKRYVPPSGHLKSYERVFKEVFKTRHPAWRTQWSGEELKTQMREDFLRRI